MILLSDLAVEYCKTTRRNARGKFLAMIDAYPELKSRLGAMGFDRKTVTSRMREVICEYLGEP